MKELKCFMCGHSARNIIWLARRNGVYYKRLKNNLKCVIECLIKKGYTHFVTCMSIGSETLFAELVLLLKSDYPQIKLECTIPNDNYIKFLYNYERKWYRKLLEKADIVNQSEDEQTPINSLEQKIKLLDASNLLLTLWDGEQKGELWQTVAHAKENYKKIEQVTINEDGFTDT